MKQRKLFLSIAALVMIAGTALLLGAVPQKLGRPGVRAYPIPGDARWRIDLPERILDYDSTPQGLDAKALEMLPKDTSFAERIYFKPGAVPFVSSVVLMGTDRTSIHKAEYCLQGEGMHIVSATRELVPMTRPQPYNLPVIKILGTDSKSVDGKTVTKACVYVYWYVADGALSNDRSGMERMWWMAKKLVFTGVLQRWAYVRYYAFCDPGQEDATFAEIKRAIAASVPEFQLTPAPADAAVAASH
jgi:hypothetical protein